MLLHYDIIQLHDDITLNLDYNDITMMSWVYSELQKCPNVWYCLIVWKLTYQLQQMEELG